MHEGLSGGGKKKKKYPESFYVEIQLQGKSFICKYI